jgi:hypothetical protein
MGFSALMRKLLTVWIVAHSRQDEVPHDLRAPRATRLAGDDGAQLCRGKTLGKLLDLRGLSGALADSESSQPR